MPSTRALILAEGLSREYLLHRQVAPKRFAEDGSLIVAVTAESLLDDVDDLAFLYDTSITLEHTSVSEVEQLIERLATDAERSIELSRGMDEDELTADVRDLANQPPVVRYVNLVVRDAYDARASDIHLEATRAGLSARLRIDGVLTPAPEPPAGLHLAVVSRIKLLAELDIAERRRPQDGRIRVKLESRELDLRVSTVPTMYGESIVLRLLDRGGRPVGLNELGLDDMTLRALTAIAERPHGMLLATGPTGSGKTTTLYAALSQRDATAEKIMTVEDPIEYQLPGITQVPVHREAGTSIATVLRSILRQDPDVLFVGEMRDTETAILAVQAAMTGHLVFSSLHTNDAVGAIPRMIDLGIPPYLVAATLDGVLAQRLVRRICGFCQMEYRPQPAAVAALSRRPVSHPVFMRGAGCNRCRGTGYSGRVGIFELLCVDDELRDAIGRGVSRGDLRAIAVRSGMRALRDDGWTKIESGITTVEEVLRVAEA